LQQNQEALPLDFVSNAHLDEDVSI